MNVLEAIKNRHSYRGKYKDIKIPRADLETIIQAGIDAPSGCNMQTTYFIGVDDGNVLNQLKSVIEPPVAETAPSAICVLTKRVNAYRNRCYATQDYAAAIENMLLTAVELGYQSCWYEGHITDEDGINHKMEEILNVPKEYELVCFLPIGIADEQAQAHNKKGFDNRASFNQFSINDK